MPIRFMQHFFDPESIAVIGASERSDSLGGTVLSNLLSADYPGTLLPVNPKGGDTIFGVTRHESVASLPDTPELAIVCTSPVRIPAIVDELGKKGVRAVLIVMGGLSTRAKRSLLGLKLDSGKTLKEATWEVAQSYDMRIMGPNCVGTVVPRNRLNASYAHCMVADGGIAYVAQSGVLALALMDWAKGRDIGLSHVTSVGDSLDVDIADVVDYLADDFRTRAILVHIENIESGPRFVSALRAAARNKLVIVMKSRRVPESQEHANRIAGGLVNPDVVYDAVLQRAGVLRLQRSGELFNALEMLTRMRRLQGERLAIVCNGVGPALLATDRLILTGGQLASLGEDTIKSLRECLPGVASAENPIDMSILATPDNFVRVLEILRAAKEVDGVLVIHVPSLVARPQETAEAIAPLAREMAKPVLTCWMGLETARTGRKALDAADVSTFDTPEQAVDAFMHMARYRHNQEQLDQNPQPLDDSNGPRLDSRTIWATVGAAKHDEREQLDGDESLEIVKAAGIAVSSDLDKTGIDGLRSLNLGMGILRDPVFGPLLYFGVEGESELALAERQVGLPPLNSNLARMLIDSTAAGSVLADYSSDPARDRDTLAGMLVRLSELAIEVAAIAELVLSPLIVDSSGVMVHGARARVGERQETAILPYPADLEEMVTLPRSGREIMLRPIRGEDAPAHVAFAQRLSAESIRLRFFGPRSALTQHELAQFTQIDYAREMAFIATAEDADGEAQTYGVVRAWTDPDNVSAEFAVLIDDSLRGEGLGHLLMQKMIDYTRQRGTLELRGTVLPGNRPMKKLASKLGFSSRYSSEEQAVVVALQLNEPTDDWQRQRLTPKSPQPSRKG
jgi:acyl-CoA synthetase (NDP forming)/RimJ/RimL family protein N-acetyltransferase